VPSCGRVARGLVEHELAPLGVEGTVLGYAKVVVSELVNNDYLHGVGRIDLLVSCAGGRLRIEVADQGVEAAVTIREPRPELGGLGLRVVDRLAIAWGVGSGTTRVWAELTVDDEGPQGE
jgi:anti-sigma regulatory factor (Ser/Thr protein kinase)